MGSIEDIILGDDRRGIGELRRHLAPDYCRQAAKFLLDTPGAALIATGFYIHAAAPETDGPPGALALGRALEALGRRVAYVSDCYTVPMLRPLVGESSPVFEFPIVDAEASREYAAELLSQLDPSLLISIERCGLTADGRYLNMRGLDISEHTAKVDYLVFGHARTIGIGDGGNEIGMGILAPYIPEVDTLPSNPATTNCTQLIISSTSNWGGYGLVAGLSLLTGRNLLPTQAEEAQLIRRMVELGAVDGVTGASQCTVDSMSLEEHGRALSMLHRYLESHGIAEPRATLS